jgi:exonuclease SbcD
MFVELTLVTKDYLSASEKRKLHRTHKGIISIIPELKQSDQQQLKEAIDLNKDLKSLFAEYFKYRKGQSPGLELLNVLDEIIQSRT